jgi:hypothetical protein
MRDSRITSNHLLRDAYLYIRQSTPRQVSENGESTRRQYALRERAVAAGWPAERIRGLVRLADGRCARDPDAGIQASIVAVFEAFAAAGTIPGALRQLRASGIRFPQSAWGGENAGTIISCDYTCPQRQRPRDGGMPPLCQLMARVATAGPGPQDRSIPFGTEQFLSLPSGRAAWLARARIGTRAQQDPATVVGDVRA